MSDMSLFGPTGTSCRRRPRRCGSRAYEWRSNRWPRWRYRLLQDFQGLKRHGRGQRGNGEFHPGALRARRVGKVLSSFLPLRLAGATVVMVTLEVVLSAAV